MTKEELKTLVKDTIDYCVHNLVGVDNPYISKRDYNEAVKPIATLAVLNGYTWLVYDIAKYSDIMDAYLKSLSFIVRIRAERYLRIMHQVINAQYDAIYKKVKDDANMTPFDLIVVLDELFEEVEK